MATPTKVYPLAAAENGQPLRGQPGIPHVTTEVATKAEAEALEATGAWTTKANHPNRVPAAEATPPTEPPASTPAPDEEA